MTPQPNHLQDSGAVKPVWTLNVGRTMGHVHKDGNYTGLTMPLKTAEQREFAAYVIAALVAFEPPVRS